jgi:hypothetical protein
MTDRRQLPPQIKRVELTQRGGGAVIRYQLWVQIGTSRRVASAEIDRF